MEKQVLESQKYTRKPFLCVLWTECLTHIGKSPLEAEEMLVNLHTVDSNRWALGKGSLDVDTIIMALYLIESNQEGIFMTPEPLGPGGDSFRPCMVD